MKRITIEEFKNNHSLYKEIMNNYLKDGNLTKRGKALFKYFIEITEANNGKFDPKNTFVTFGENYPLFGYRYDDIRICNIDTEDIIYLIIPVSGFETTNSISFLYGDENKFDCSLAEGTFNDILNYFKI